MCERARKRKVYFGAASISRLSRFRDNETGDARANVQFGAVRFNGLECSARASVLYLLSFYRPYRPNEGHRRSQTCRSHVYYPNMCAIRVAILVGCRLRVPGLKKTLFERGLPVLRNFGLATPIWVHLWSSVYIIRRHTAFDNEMLIQRASHVHYAYAYCIDTFTFG